MELDEVFETRRSVHQYADDELSDETLERIFERVRHAPSSFNLQPWEFLVLRDDDTKAALREAAYDQQHVTDAAASVVVFGNTDPTAHVERVLSDQLEKGYLPNEEAKAGVRDSIEGMAELPESERRVWTTRSTALAAMALMHAAWDEGVASCPVGGFDADAIAEAFDVPDGYEPVLVLTLGYPAADAADIERPRKFRRPVDEIVHHESLDVRSTAAEAPADD